MARAFTVGDPVRYKPGGGTYGYEDALDKDGRVAGIVLGFSATRVRVRLTMRTGGGAITRTVTRCVDADSLIHAAVVRTP